VKVEISVAEVLQVFKEIQESWQLYRTVHPSGRKEVLKAPRSFQL